MIVQVHTLSHTHWAMKIFRSSKQSELWKPTTLNQSTHCATQTVTETRSESTDGAWAE